MTSETRQTLLSIETVRSWSLNKPKSRTTSKNSYSYTSPVYSARDRNYTNLIVSEKHYTVAEIAEMWGISTDLARDTFVDEPGVLTFERPRTRVKRGYSTMRIPESVVVRVHTRLTSSR